MTKRKTNRLGFIGISLYTLNIAAVIALLLSYSAAFFNPDFFWPIAFFGLAYLPIFVANIFFVVIWIFRKPKNALLSAVALLLGWNLMVQHITFSRPEQIVSKDSSLRIMSYNVHLLVHADDEKVDTKDSIISIINDVDPDVLCMQEFQSTLNRRNAFMERLKKECGFKDYYFGTANYNDYHGYGQIIYSKYPIVNSGSITKNAYGINRIIFADIAKDNDTVRIYNVHLRSFGLQSEDKEFIQNPSEAVGGEKVNTSKVGRKLRNAFSNRGSQALSLVDHIRQTDYGKIVVGDFNDTPMSYSVNVVNRELTNAFKEKGSGWGVTHYKLFPVLQIDYIFTDYKVLDYRVVKKKFSDHYPIWADLKI